MGTDPAPQPKVLVRPRVDSLARGFLCRLLGVVEQVL